MGGVTILQLWTLLAFLCGTSLAGPQGQNFITVFMQNYKLSYSTADLQLFITGYSPSTTVTVWINKSSFKLVLTVDDRSTITVQVPAFAELPGTTMSCNVIGIKADKPVSVLALNSKLQSSDTSIVYPVEDLGTDYYVVTPLDGPSDAYKEFAVVSYDVNVAVDIYLKGAVSYQEKTFAAGSKLSVLLQPYSALQLLSKDNLSGTHILSRTPVAVLSGHTCTWKNTKCNHVYEQLQPVPSWGTSFIIPPIYFQRKPDIVFVVAVVANTKINYQVGAQKSSQTLNTGQVIQLQIPMKTPIYLTSSAGIQVIYYCTGWQDSSSIQYDTTLITIPPISSYCSSYYIYSQANFDNYGTIVARTTDISKVTFNKGPDAALTWSQIPGTDYSWATQRLGKGFSMQTLENSYSPFMLLSYGLAKLNNYGSPATCINVNTGPSCATVKCRAKETCQLINGSPICVPNSVVYCYATGDPHYRTFDGRLYDFQGTCTYTIAKTCGNDSSLPVFNIQAKNENRGNTRVAYVSYVTIQAYNQSISLVRYEYGFVRVNNQRQRLPISLNGGQVRLYQSGGSVVIETEFSLKVYYDWISFLKIYISSSFFGSVCGLCGNYNGNPADDLMTPAGTQTSSLVDFGKSWKVVDGDLFCWDNCNGVCPTCPLATQQIYSSEQSCGLISKALNGPFSQCNAVIDPKPYLDDCVYDLCMYGGFKQILCQSIKTYVDVCQRNNISIGDWRQLSGCPMQCPDNSEYTLCAQACPATCNDNAIPSICSESCVESCQCKAGYVLDGGNCIPKSGCGCVYKGQLFAPNEKFWGDNKCQTQCICNPSTRQVECKATNCKSSEQCSIVNGIQNCYPISYGNCSASGDPHFITFDGVRYDFQGTCIYQFVGLCKKSDNLVDFQVNVQNENRGSKVVAYVSAVQVKICDFDIVIDRRYKDRILLNGLLTNLPFVVDNGKLSIYKQGNFAVVHTSFGLTVTYDWKSRVAVTLPSSYAGAVCGLCGNFDNDKTNDFLMSNNQLTTQATVFGKSWRVQNVTGCHEEDTPSCPKLAQMQLLYSKSNDGCGILRDINGPFRECFAKINPEEQFQNCVYDACFYEGRQDVICELIAGYVALCQEAGVTIYPWRTKTFCSPVCPRNSHYEISAPGCAPTCLSLSSPLGCAPGYSEGCVCDGGFILSGGDCVPLSQCGCSFNNKYYKAGEIFFPNSFCNQKCVCTDSGVVQCAAFSCGPNEECKVVNGVQKCQAVGSAICSASGDPHYISFDAVYFDFQGNCTYTLTKTITQMDNLVPFVVNVKHEKWGNGKVTVTKMVSLEVYGNNLILQYGVKGKILVNGVYFNLPVNLENGKIRAYQHGVRVLIDTDFGVRVSYDLVYSVLVTVPGNYKGQLGGLCGNYNGDKKDDFQLPDRTVTTDATIFGNSWVVQIPGVYCDGGCGGKGNPCPACDDRRKTIFKTENYCGFLGKSNGPLSACYATIDPTQYINNCIYDLCAGGGDGDILCQNIQSYVAACQASGVTVQPWRTNNFCPLNCAANSEYKVCADVCSVTCAGVTDPDECPETCSEGCECIDGFFFDGQGCVSMDNCGCFEDGIYYPPNVNVLSSDCKQACTCSPVGGLMCENTTCAADETCQNTNGVIACAPKDLCKTMNCRIKETCKIQGGNPVCVPNFSGTCWAWGDPHFHTFDGYNYDFQGTCTYVLAQYSGGDSGLVPFTIQEKNDNRGTQAVSYVRSVDIYTYGQKISIVKGEFGKVRVNDVITNLPLTLLDGKITASISGLNAVVRTNFGLQVSYEYKWYVVVTLSSSYYGLTQGLCGNFNQNIKDELITADKKVVTSIVDWAKSWKINDRDPFCFDSCPGLKCPTCSDAKKNLYGGDKLCGLISNTTNGAFRECHSIVSPDAFFDNCLYDVCINGGAKQFLCQALNAYANTCRKQGANIYDWRTPSGCVLPCQANSHYEFCGKSCPNTCTDRSAAVQCTDNCVETCQCNDSYVLSGDKCVPISECGCTYNGAYYQANQEFWADENCHTLCKCDPSVGMVVCNANSCKTSERCMIVNGVRSCQPISFDICEGSGDPHYTSFDGKKFDFMGTCIYQLVGVTSTNLLLPRFNVTVQNYNRGGNKAVSYAKVVTMEVYNIVLTLSMDYPRRILVNGVVTSLPFYYQTNKVVVYISGKRGIVKTDFDVTVTYDWNMYVAVKIPSTYRNAVGGLCGTYNKNASDDFTMKDGNLAPNSVQFGNSWKVGDVSGCSPQCTGNCPVCSDAQKQAYASEKYCGLIKKPDGTFSQCYKVVNPTPYFNDCIFDACQYQGYSAFFCDAIALYVAACQEAGVNLQEWRSPSFCSPSCPPSSHYELCGNSCPITCYGLTSPTGCDMLCSEGCYCDDGYVMSGDTCVPIANCGCVYQEKYYQKNEIFYPEGVQCNQKCQCGADGIVRCKSDSCGPEEECKLVNGVWACQAKGCGRCVASGDPHYISFDGLRFDFQGTCAYTFAKVVADDPHLEKFSFVVENESYGNGNVAVTRRVLMHVYGYKIAFERNMKATVKVDEELFKLPLVLGYNNIVVNQEGNNVVLQTDFGLKFLFDTSYYMVLSIPSSYSGKMGGLCGNFNGDTKDDFQLPNKQVVQQVNDFGLSWKVNITGAKCSDGCNEGECPVCTDAKLQPFKATSSCGMLTNPSGPFGSCHSTINPVDYFNFCIYDSCAVNGQVDTLCKSLQAYAAACQTLGVTIGSWRTSTFCSMSCPANSHYELCNRTCEQTCSGLTAPLRCTTRCFEGCACNTGYVLDGEKCVTMDKCGCVYDGKYMSVGDSFITLGCTRKCSCQAAGVTCTQVSCSDKERCNVVNGVRGCYRVEGECSMNSQNFSTFDGLTGGPVGNGPVEVTSLCNNDTRRWFRVIADIQNCGTAPALVARLHIFLAGSIVTISKDNEAWVNGRLASFPIVSGVLSANVGGSSISIQIGADLKIELSNSGNLDLHASEKLSDTVCGACGNFNGDLSDDLQSPEGNPVTNVLQLIASWRARDFTSCNA